MECACRRAQDAHKALAMSKFMEFGLTMKMSSIMVKSVESEMQMQRRSLLKRRDSKRIGQTTKRTRAVP